MPLPFMRRLWMTLLLLILSVITFSACSGLAGEPEIVATLPVRATSIPATPEIFDGVVNLEQGAVIFAENCVRCHGITGTGNGELVLSGQIQNVPDFTDPTTIQEISLQDWFATITNGRIENLMPPWKDTLSAQDRWAVALYTYTMSFSDTNITQGQAVYTAQCVDCHADDGSGTENGSYIQGLVNFTESELAEMVFAHQADLALSPVVEEQALSDVVQYLRLLSAESQILPDTTTITTQPEPASTEEPGGNEPDVTPVQIPQAIGILRGRIIQGTEGGESVEGLEAIVHIYDSQLREQIAEYTVGADGTYQYEEVVIRSDFAYRMTVLYEGITYTSPVVIGDPNTNEIELDVVIYERGATADNLVITSRASQANLLSEGLYIIEVIDILNTSDRAFVRDDVEGVDGRVSVEFAIPNDAQLQLDHTDPNRIALSNDGLTVYDMSAVLPGQEHYVQFSYLLPIESLQNIQQPIDYNVAGPVAFFVENSHLSFTSDQTELSETRPFNGQQYNVHTVTDSLNIGDTIIYTLTMQSPPLAGGTTDTQTLTREALSLILVLGGIALIGGAGVIIWHGRNASPSPTIDLSVTSEELMKQIATLDNAYDKGDIEEGAYQKQRQQLKNRLLKVLKSEGNTS